MTDAALTSPSAYSHVRIREPAGERTFGDSPTIGGPGADIIVPGLQCGGVIQIARSKGTWVVQPMGGYVARVNGSPLTIPRDLRRQDVISVGDAQIVVSEVSRTLLRVDVCHLVGNATVSPASAVATMELGDGDDEVQIKRPAVARLAPAQQMPRQLRLSPAAASVAAVAGVLLLLVLLLLSYLQTVVLDIQPTDARVRVPGAWIAIHLGHRLLLLPGVHDIRAEHRGYAPAQTRLMVRAGISASVHLRLAKLPGTLHVDTGGVAAVVSIDGAESGQVPGVIAANAGAHTLLLRASHYVDYIAEVNIAGAGQRQELKVTLQPSWGTLQISAVPTGARVIVDDVDAGPAPTVVDAPSGVRHVRISAPGLKTWESSLVLRAGEALAVGPITLGQSDAHLTVRSQPSGAEVTIGGVLRGRTPLEVDLPAGIQHEVVVNSPGFAPWTQQVFAAAGQNLAVDARPEIQGARVTIQGTPNGAQLLIDGVDRGVTPQALDLSGIEHRIEVRREGWIPFTAVVTPAKGFDRTVQYRLSSASAARGSETATTLYTQTGYSLRRIPAGMFRMGGDSEVAAGRHGDAGYREVTFKRPAYLGVTLVSNEQFRRFRVNHHSGTPEQRSVDLDDMPATEVTWNDAAGYCNWLSERDSLPLAYDNTPAGYVLHQPVTIGYRLPTEAEWEYAARSAGPLEFRHTEWVNDYYISKIESAPATDPLGPKETDRHVVRGVDEKAASAATERLARREGASSGAPTLGFRVARYAE